MDTVKLLEQALAAGLSVDVDGDRLRVRGPKSAEPMVRLLAQYKAEIIAVLSRKGREHGADAAVPCSGVQPVADLARLLDPEVAWRIEAMRPQAPPRGAIPPLVARSDVVHEPGCCASCGEPLPEGARIRCAACREAAWQVLNEGKKGLTQ